MFPKSNRVIEGQIEMKIKFALLPLALALIVAAGCGGKSDSGPTGAVSGTVTLDGVPFSDGQLSLFSQATGSGATLPLDEEGTFKIGDLLKAGDYTVAVIPLPPPPPGGAPAAPGAKPSKPTKEKVSTTIPKKYLNAKTSGLTLSIAPGKNSLNVEMVSTTKK
ncbi:hypothetical protein SH668x_001997 [Planctomicrobium sp. SH668]|uniref:hypothetical protein n=1 Tax=Planctomicrobium sp. SH668 TaxID=3448126 RepID=UPI003F5AE88E